MSEDCRRLPKTFEEDPKMFRWYTNKFKYNLRDKLDITEIIDIFTCEDMISSHVRISYHFYHFVTTRYTTDFYIIKWNYQKCSLLALLLTPIKRHICSINYIMWYVFFYNEAPIFDYCNCLKEMWFHSALKDTSVWSFSYNVWNFYDPVTWSQNKAVFL